MEILIMFFQHMLYIFFVITGGSALLAGFAILMVKLEEKKHRRKHTHTHRPRIT